MCRLPLGLELGFELMKMIKSVVCVLGEKEGEDGGVCLENKMNGVGFRCLLKIEKRGGCVFGQK